MRTETTSMTRAVLLAPALALLPAVARADVGSLGGVAMIALGVLAAIWVALTLLVFVLPRRSLSVGKRLAWAVLFLVSPVLLFSAVVLKEYVLDERVTYVSQVTRKPLFVAGAMFPPGSRADYEQEGRLFGHRRRTLQSIHAPQAVSLGGVRIDGLAYDASSRDEIHLELSEDQVIDGWHCVAGGGIGTTMDVTRQGASLRSCTLAAAREWQGRMVPAGSHVFRSGDGWDFIAP